MDGAERVLHLRRPPPLAPRRQRLLVGRTNRKTSPEPPPPLASPKPPAGLPTPMGTAVSGGIGARGAEASLPPVPKALDWASAEVRAAWRRQFLRRRASARFGYEHAVRDTSGVLAVLPGTDGFATERDRFVRGSEQIGREERDSRRASERARVARIREGRQQAMSAVLRSDAVNDARDRDRIAAIAEQRARYRASVSAAARVLTSL
eukprot:c46395_g1_i1.p2 GENE.c46395_g1_i1~~c46395_g1_i1.p2  ORF type:complete len:216 (+),score=9.48 c46395_g1_i1:29-649(+)